MKRVSAFAVLILLAACSRQNSSPAASAPSETTYTMTGTVVSRDPARNTLNIDNREVPGKMAAMKMDYEVRDARVAELPADGAAVEMTVHDRDGQYSITGVRELK